MSELQRHTQRGRVRGSPHGHSDRVISDWLLQGSLGSLPLSRFMRTKQSVFLKFPLRLHDSTICEQVFENNNMAGSINIPLCHDEPVLCHEAPPDLGRGGASEHRRPRYGVCLWERVIVDIELWYVSQYAGFAARGEGMRIP
jgi:hypothetical protein